MSLPHTYTKINETGCCAVPNINEWQDTQQNFENKLFIRMYTRSFLYIPLNMAKIMKKIDAIARANNSVPPTEDVMILSRDISPWRAEQLYAVSKPISDADMVTLEGSFLTKVFEGSYKNAKSWYVTMQNAAKKTGKQLEAIYMFYTTCPRCAKHYGKNYVIGLAHIQ